VLFIDHTAALGGGEIAMLNLVQHLDRSRYEPEVLLFSDGPLCSRLRNAGIPVHVSPLSETVVSARKDSLGLRSIFRMGDVARTLRQILQVRRFIRSGQYALVHTNSLKADIIGGIAGRLARKPVIWHVRDRIADDYLPPLVVRVFRRLARLLPNHLIANSSATLSTVGRRPNSSVVSSGVVLDDRASVVHDGTITETSSQRSAQNSFVQRVGIVGRLTPWKGQHIFIRAAAALAPRFPHARFLIVGSALFGETAYESQLRDLVKKLDLSHRVKFTGFRPNVAAIMETLDIAVHASTVAEPFGQVIIEAMAACKPVIATNGGGVPEIMLHGRTGLMVPMNDPDAMAEALSRLLSNPKLAHEMGQHGRRHVEKYFTIQHTSAKVMRCYDQVLARSGSRSIPSPPDSASPLPA